MPWKKGTRIPTNLIVGFLGSGKTTAIANLLTQRPNSEHWSVLVNEFGTVSIDQALVESQAENVAIEELGGGCACCTMSFVFKPLLARFVRRSKPDRLILEPSGLSHPAKVVDILRSDDFSGAIDLRNIICIVDPKDIDDPRWQESEVYTDQVQLADIVALNWTDLRDQQQIQRCRKWLESFNPPKQLILETKFGQLDANLLDQTFDAARFPLFAEAHPTPQLSQIASSTSTAESAAEQPVETKKPLEGIPACYPNKGLGHNACGWIFHVNDVFERDRLLDLLGSLKGVVRLKGIFRCKKEWWAINRAKEATDFQVSTYRKDSRLEIILSDNSINWDEFGLALADCLVKELRS